MSEDEPSASTYWKAGQVYMRKGDVQRGIAFLQRATQLDNGHAGAWLSLGVALAGVGSVGNAAVCLAMASVKGRVKGDWPDSVCSVANTNLHTLAKKHSLWPTDLASRLSDPSYSSFLLRCLAQTSLPPTIYLAHSTSLETLTICDTYPNHTIASYHPSPLMNLVEANLCAAHTNREVIDSLPDDCPFVVLGSGTYPTFDNTEIPFQCVPETIVLYGCLVESQDLWDLNSVSLEGLQAASGIDDMSAAVEGLKSNCRPVPCYKWKVGKLSKRVVLKEYPTAGTMEDVEADIEVTSTGMCAGLVVWKGFRHGSEEYDIGMDAELPHVWQYMLYRDSLQPVEVGDSVKVQVGFTNGEFACTFVGSSPKLDRAGAKLPPYHAVMLNDHPRTRSYHNGLVELAQTMPHSALVLDLGCGTGLLSLLAAKAGFTNVVAVERFEEIADTAQKIIKANGMQDKIKLVVKHSVDIKVGKGGDLPKQADIMVHEIFGTDPLSEGLLPAYNEAVRKGLVGKGTVFCPCKFRVWAAVCSSDFLEKQGGLTSAMPFFVVPRKLEEDVAKIQDLVYHSEPAVVWEVELTGELLPTTGSRDVVLPVVNTPDEAVHLVVYWFDFLNGETALYSTKPESSPETPVAHWVHNIDLLPEGIEPSEEGFKVTMSWATDRIMFKKT